MFPNSSVSIVFSNLLEKVLARVPDITPIAKVTFQFVQKRITAEFWSFKDKMMRTGLFSATILSGGF